MAKKTYNYELIEDLLASLDEKIIAPAKERGHITSEELVDRLVQERVASNRAIRQLQKQLAKLANGAAPMLTTTGMRLFRALEVDSTNKSLRETVKNALLPKPQYQLIGGMYLQLVLMDMPLVKATVPQADWNVIFYRERLADTRIRELLSESLQPAVLEELMPDEKTVQLLNDQMDILDEQRAAMGLPTMAQIVQHKLGLQPFIGPRVVDSSCS